jgi:hypothetical protein
MIIPKHTINAREINLNGKGLKASSINLTILGKVYNELLFFKVSFAEYISGRFFY